MLARDPDILARRTDSARASWRGVACRYASPNERQILPSWIVTLNAVTQVSDSYSTCVDMALVFGFIDVKRSRKALKFSMRSVESQMRRWTEGEAMRWLRSPKIWK